MISRRNALNKMKLATLSAVAAGTHLIPFQALARSLAATYINEAKSKYLNNKVSAFPARNLFQVNLAGAPSRWYFDHLLKPHDTDRYIAHPGIHTELYKSQDGYSFNSHYKTHKMLGYNFPSLWQCNVAKAGGGMRPMQDLQNHMLMIRGAKMFHPGHQVNIARQVCPDQGGLSLTGLVADHSGAMIPAISTGNSPASRAYKSAKGFPVLDIPVDHPNYVNYLFENFLELQKSNKNIKNDIELAAQEAQSIIQSYTMSNLPGSEVLFNEKFRSNQIIKMKLEHLSEVFSELQKKYTDLMTRSESQKNLNGINDFSLILPKFPLEMNGKKSLEDSLGHFNCEGHYPIIDTREIFEKTNKTVLAKQFALAEFCLTEGLCSSIHAGPQSEARWFSDTKIDFPAFHKEVIIAEYNKQTDKTIFKIKPGSSPVIYGSKFNTDTHFLGALANFHACNKFYLGFSSSLLELVDRLKDIKINNSTLFDETIIHIASEFDRDPDPTLCGTSHNYRAGVTSIVSGIIKKPLVIGNILVGKESGERAGTRGDAAPVKELGNRAIDFRHLSSTLSEVLRVPPIVARAQSLVKEQSGQFVSVIETAKNVES